MKNHRKTMEPGRAVKRTVRPGQWINDNNICQMAPFWYNSDLKVLEIINKFHAYWSQNDTIELLEKQGFKCVSVDQLSGGFPPDTFSSDLPDWYWEVYKTCCDRADASRWHHLLPDTILATLDELKKLEIIPPKHGWFVKTSLCSTKHDFPPTPVFSVEEAIAQLMASPKASKFLAKGAKILLRPWIKDISKDNEVRVFVREGKVVGVSQQHCYSSNNALLNMLDADTIIDAAQRCYGQIAAGLPEKYGFQDECTFDGYIDSDTNIQLIEINSGMFGWGPAGSSLFAWLRRPPPGIGEPPVFLLVGG